ncbi:MAG TPA: PTS sugar transporter subunit IIC [Longimicrobiales bacterium]|nr:PTS sugar transporter subunit IIC [Longimicrobiales bacterium]
MTWVLLIVLGGLVALDGAALIQTMISRPLVAGTLAGAVLGDAALGLQVGAILELFLLVAVPAGGGRMPDGGIAAVVAVAAATAAPGPGGLALAIAGGLIWGELAGRGQVRVRIWNGAHAPLPDRGTVDSAAVSRSIGLGLLAEAARGFLATGVGVALARGLTPVLAAAWPVGSAATMALLLLGGLVSVGVVFRGRGLGVRASVLFGAGMTLGLLAGWTGS